MKIRPIILCGGSGTRLWPDFKKHEAKQFIDFGGWTLFGRTLERVKGASFDVPIISTNSKYVGKVIYHLKKQKIKKYKIILEPVKRNTGPAILSAALLDEIPEKQPLIFLSADHLIKKVVKFKKEIHKNKKYLTNKNIFIFGIKPSIPSDQFGYFTTKKRKNLTRVSKFIEKPNILKVTKIINKGGLCNSGIFLIRKDSVINNYKKYQKKIYANCYQSVKKSIFKKNIYYLKKNNFIKNSSRSFDYAILEKTKDINAINLQIDWSDLGSWREICLMYKKDINKYINKKNIFIKPWGKYINLFRGHNFLIKELYIKPKGILSLQKHFHRSEHWVITKGNPKITLNNKVFYKKPYETIFIPKGAKHRIQNPNKKPVKIMEAQLGSILKETDIVRFKDVYGRIN